MSLCCLSCWVETLTSGLGFGEELLDWAEDLVVGDGSSGLGTIPDVEAFGDDGTVLGGDSINDAVEAGAAEVLALDALIFGGRMAAG
jgi:hypothetical protein